MTRTRTRTRTRIKTRTRTRTRKERKRKGFPTLHGYMTMCDYLKDQLLKGPI